MFILTFCRVHNPAERALNRHFPPSARLDVFNNMITVERIFIAILYRRVLLIFVNILKNPFITYTTIRIM
jgi:hypothetical protein